MDERDGRTGDYEMETKCRRIFYSLLEMLERPGGQAAVTAPNYFREWEETKRCDWLRDMSSIRAENERKISKESLDKILKYDDKEKDEARALFAMSHYASWHRKVLLESLSWQQYVEFFLVTRPSTILAGTALLGGGMRGVQLATRAFISRKDKMPPASSR